MDADPGATGHRIRRRLPPTAAVCLAFLLLETGILEDPYGHWVSNLVQLALAAAAAVCCWRAASRGEALARSFWILVGAGMALWALAQCLWTLGPLGADKLPLVVAARDVLFVSCSAPLIAACVVRPDRPRLGALGLAADVGLVAALALFIYAYFPVAHLARGAANPYQHLAPALYNPQRLMLLGLLLWLLRTSHGAWRRLYAELALAIAIFHAGGVVSNLAVVAGSYRPGLHDLPWALPLLWVALAARDWQPEPRSAGPDAEDGEAAAWQARDWQEARRGNVVALAAVVLVPAVHLVATLVGSPDPAVARLRGRIALAGTLLVGALYLVRQLRTLRRAEATQSARELRFRALVENSTDAIGILDREGRFSFLSASAERVIGYRPDELAGNTPLALAHPDELEPLRQAFAGLVSRAWASSQGLVRYRHADGTFRHGQLEATNRLLDPAVRGIVLHFRDVSERRWAQEERERSLSLLEATLESTADGILVEGQSGRVTHWNAKLAAMWRVPREQLAAHDGERVILRIVAPELEAPAAFVARVRELDGQPEAASFDTLQLGDGRAFELYSLPQRLAGEVVGRVWSFRDVSERQHARRAMARLVAILEATPDFVGMADAGGRPLHVNRAGRQMVGLAEDEALGDGHVAQFYSASGAACVLEHAIPEALRGGSWSGETALKHRSGREIPVLQVVLAHRSPGGEVEFLSTIARDISERKLAEEQLRRSQTMAALGSLVAGVAHEVRNPLFGMSSTLDAFDARFAAQHDHGPYVQGFRDQLDRLSGLMNDLLEYGKPPGLALAEGGLDEVFREATAACAPLAERAKVALESRVAPDLPALRRDRPGLLRAFHNLLLSAVQHSPEGGTVRLAAEAVRRDGAAWIECVVEGPGPGFREEDLPHVFEPFFARRQGDSGLGLAIAHRIVADHGGTLAAHNRPGGGAGVRVLLPTATAALEKR